MKHTTCTLTCASCDKRYKEPQWQDVTIRQIVCLYGLITKPRHHYLILYTQPDALPVICKPHTGDFFDSLCRSACVIDRTCCTHLDCELEADSLRRKHLHTSLCKLLSAYIQAIVQASSMRYQYSNQPIQLGSYPAEDQGTCMKA